MEEGDIAAAIEQRRDSTSSLTDTAAIVSSFAAADTPSVDAINITLPVLRHYIPRPVLIALDAGQSIWSSQFFRVTTLFVRLSGLSYASVAYLAELQVCISLQSPPPPCMLAFLYVCNLSHLFCPSPYRVFNPPFTCFMHHIPAHHTSRPTRHLLLLWHTLPIYRRRQRLWHSRSFWPPALRAE